MPPNAKQRLRITDSGLLFFPPSACAFVLLHDSVEPDNSCTFHPSPPTQRNYRSFLLFVFTSTVLCLYVIGCGLAQIFVRHNELVDLVSLGKGGVGRKWECKKVQGCVCGEPLLCREMRVSDLLIPHPAGQL